MHTNIKPRTLQVRLFIIICFLVFFCTFLKKNVIIFNHDHVYRNNAVFPAFMDYHCKTYK